MTPLIRSWLPIVAAGVLFSLTFAGKTFSQDSTDAAKNKDKDDAAAEEKSIREQDIYIPYDKLRQVFEKHGRGVFLPYDKFQELWKAAQGKIQPSAEIKPPEGWVITEIENEARVEKDVVRVKAKLKIDMLAEGWHKIPLRLADSAITSARLGEQPARILGESGQEYRLLIEKKGKQSEQIELNLEYAKAITRSPGQNSVSFQTPQAPVSRWKVTIPQAGVKVNLQPLIAASEVPSGEKSSAEADQDKKAEETVVLAFVGAAPTVQIDWTPKAEGATGLAALTGVQAQQQLWIKESVTHCTTTLDYAISRAELDKLSIETPADYKVVNVFDDNVRKWTVESAAGKQKIAVELFEPAKKSQRIVVELEKIAGEKTQDAIQAPVVKALEASRQQGIVVVQIADGLRGEAAKTSGLLQIDATELPPDLAREKWAFSYRYATVPYELSFSLEKILPRISANSLVNVYLDPESLSADALTVFNIERAGVFKLEFDLPPGLDVRSVKGVDSGGAKAVKVDSHRLEGEKKTHLVVNLSGKALGPAALLINLRKDLHLPELLAPTGKSADIELSLPQVTPATVERARGSFVIYAPESMQVNVDKPTGLGKISFTDAAKIISMPQRSEKTDNHRPVFAFAFTEEPASLILKAERRKPQVTVRQLLVVRIEDGVAKYQDTFFYNVLYSGVKSLRIDIPEEIAKIAHTQTAHETITPSPDGLPKGYVAWRLSNDAELFGDGKIELVWEKKIDNLDIGKSVPLPLPDLKPAEVNRAWGQIVLTKSETIDLREKGEPKALQPIDPQQDLMEKVEAAARAFSFHDDWEMTVVATRYDLEEVKRTNIERGLVRMVVTPANEISVQALYRIRTARDRLAVNLPENVKFDTEPLRINGRAVALEKQTATDTKSSTVPEKQKSDYFIPIVAPNADAPFLLEMRYILPGNDDNRLDLPVFPQDPAVQKVFLAAYIPESKTLLNAEGKWSKEYRWQMTDSLMWKPWRAAQEQKQEEEKLLNWVRDGVSLSGNAAGDFQTDGTLFVYSTLRPESPPDGSLTMTVMDARSLQALVFLVVFLGGVMLVPARWRVKSLAVGALIALVILLGVFATVFALQILNGILALAIFLVLVLWTVGWAFRLQRRRAAMPAASGRAIPPNRDSGVDLSQYEPHHADAPQPPTPATAEPPKSTEGDGSEGGKSHE